MKHGSNERAVQAFEKAATQYRGLRDTVAFQQPPPAGISAVRLIVAVIVVRLLLADGLVDPRDLRQRQLRGLVSRFKY